ncbi:hypothetical protein F5Y12DRAFT_318065 [Xylaria sp. FL1777]|nr:hypothetical protein F5Y12DRAFT_318065 [Xylaria sp. FL1777]
MPPVCSEKRCTQNIGRRRRVSSVATRPTLRIGENVDDGDDDVDESDENISPDADKSDIRFTLERRQDSDDDNNNNDNSDRRGKDSSSGDNNQGRRNGRAGNDRGDGPPVFHNNDNEGGRFGDNKNGGGNGGDFRGTDNGGGGGGGGGGGDNNKGDSGNKGSDDDNNNNNDGKDGNNNDNNNGNGKGRGGGKDSGNDHSSSDSSSNDNSSTPPPPPPPATTSDTSTVETSTTEITTTSVVTSTTSVVSTTSIPVPETTVSSSITSLLIPLPAVENPAPIPTLTQAVPTSPVADNSPNTPQAPTSIFLPGVADSSTPAPTPTNSGNNRGNADNRHGGNGNNNNNNNNNKDRGGRLSATSERVLVATGSIGVFIVLCFIVWIIYRAIKKSKQSGRNNSNSSWLARLIPWRGQPQMSNAPALNGFYEPKEPLPAYDAGNNNSMEAFGFYDQRKLYPLEAENVVAYPSAAALQNGMAMRQTADGQPLPAIDPRNQYPRLIDQMVDSNDADSTLRSRMPDPYYNQSEFARQPSDAYNPAQRQVYRASEISSLSSGFGDGDIIMPPPNIVIAKTPIPRATLNADAVNSNNNGNNNTAFRPFSWMSRAGTEQQRDTVYTTTSDRRSRFRSVNSWVDQQKRRLRRPS